MKRIKTRISLAKTTNQNLIKLNLIFVFIFLNVWDWVIDRKLFNAMAIGVVLFGPATFLWLIGNIRAIALITLISLIEFGAMAVFIAEGLQLGGEGTAVKSVFWLPYLIMAGINGFVGLKIYSEHRRKINGQ